MTDVWTACDNNLSDLTLEKSLYVDSVLGYLTFKVRNVSDFGMCDAELCKMWNA